MSELLFCIILAVIGITVCVVIYAPQPKKFDSAKHWNDREKKWKGKE